MNPMSAAPTTTETDIMIFIDAKNRAFTLVEAIMSMAVVAIGTLAVVASLRYGDYAALRARLDARGSQEFARQSQWIVNYPPEVFREKLAQHATSGSLEDSSWPPSSSKILIPQKTEFLLPGKSAFAFRTKMTVSPPAASGDAYTVDIETEWETPIAAAAQSVRTNKLEMRGIKKW